MTLLTPFWSSYRPCRCIGRATFLFIDMLSVYEKSPGDHPEDGAVCIYCTACSNFIVWWHNIYSTPATLHYMVSMFIRGSVIPLFIFQTTKALPLFRPCGSDDRASVNVKIFGKSSKFYIRVIHKIWRSSIRWLGVIACCVESYGVNTYSNSIARMIIKHKSFLDFWW